jgi:hypothetical protein
MSRASRWDEQTRNAENCWNALTAARRVSPPRVADSGNLSGNGGSMGFTPVGGQIDPDRAKDRQLQADGLSAPRIPGDGTTGVENQYSR